MGYEIALSLDLIQHIYQIIIEINPNLIKVYLISAAFYKKVGHDDFYSEELANLAITHIENCFSNRSIRNIMENKFEGNEEMTVLLISGNKDKIGTIINTNQEIHELLGFKKEDLISMNVSTIMPEIFAQIHNKCLQKHLEHNTGRVIKEVSQIVFAQHKKGMLVPCYQIAKIMPNLNQGIQILGFLSKHIDLKLLRFGEQYTTNSKVLILLVDNQRNVVSMNDNFIRLFFPKKDPEAVKFTMNAIDNVFSIEYLFPNFEGRQDDLESSEGLSFIPNFDPLLEYFDPDTFAEDEEAKDEISPRSIRQYIYIYIYRSTKHAETISSIYLEQDLMTNAKLYKHTYKYIDDFCYILTFLPEATLKESIGKEDELINSKLLSISRKHQNST